MLFERDLTGQPGNRSSERRTRALLEELFVSMELFVSIPTDACICFPKPNAWGECQGLGVSIVKLQVLASLLCFIDGRHKTF